MKKLFTLILLLTTLQFSQAQPSHLISLDSACILISNFLQDKDLRHQADLHGIGGYIPTPESTNTISRFPALMLYPCYQNDFSFLLDDVFLAYEFHNDVIPDNPNCAITPSDQRIPVSNNRFKYNRNYDISAENVLLFLSNQQDKINQTLSTISKNEAYEYNRLFFEEYIHSMLGRISTEQYQCGGFHRDQLQEFLNQQYTNNDGQPQTVIGCRFYFGFDRQKTNGKLRLVLIATKHDGTNLLFNRDGTDAIILERHWPPD